MLNSKFEEQTAGFRHVSSLSLDEYLLAASLQPQAIEWCNMERCLQNGTAAEAATESLPNSKLFPMRIRNLAMLKWWVTLLMDVRGMNSTLTRVNVGTSNIIRDFSSGTGLSCKIQL